MHPHPYLLFFSLYLAQGLPVGFMTHALPVILRSEGVSLTQIGGFGLLMLPWSLKFFWSPLVDRYGHRRLGHYRSWIVTVQALGLLCLLALAGLSLSSLNQMQGLWLLFGILLMLNLASATQDIATDGLAVQVLTQQQQHWGNSFQVLGSRLGFLIGGGALLWWIDVWGWSVSFYVLTLLVFINSLPVLFYREPIHHQARASQPKTPISTYFRYFWQQPELSAWLGVLVCFKVLDGLSGPVLKPLLVDLGLSLSQIGLYITIFGAIAALLGALWMGYLLKRMTRVRALLLMSWCKLFSFAAYVGLAYAYAANYAVAPWLIYVINALEDALAAMLLVVMLTLIMQYSRKHLAATDFTFQVSVLATVSGGLYIVGGWCAEQLGYAIYLSLLLLVGLFCLLPLYHWRRICTQQATSADSSSKS